MNMKPLLSLVWILLALPVAGQNWSQLWTGATNYLVMDLDATNVAQMQLTNGPRIAFWVDQHTNVWNDGNPQAVFQTNTLYAARTNIDASGRPVVTFLWDIAPTAISFFFISNSFAWPNLTNTTIYICATGPVEYQTVKHGSVVYYSTAARIPIPYLAFKAENTSSPYSLETSTYLPNTPWTNIDYIPINPQVFCMGTVSHNATQNYFQWYKNTDLLTNTTALVPGEYPGPGGLIGAEPLTLAYSTFQNGFTGDMYKLMIFATNHTAAQRVQMIQSLISRFGIVTNFDSQVVWMGDSVPAGQHGSTNMYSCAPYQMASLYPNIKVFNSTFPGTLLGTNGEASSMYMTSTGRVDWLYDLTKTNILVMMGGNNDIAVDGVDCPTTWARYTNLLNIRKLNNPGWKIVGYPYGADGGSTTAQSNNLWAYTLTMRTNQPTILADGASQFIDFGCRSPIETRFNAATNNSPYYAWDTVHFTGKALYGDTNPVCGLTIMSQYLNQIVSSRHRTSFLGN